jgi:hypothetical protein
MKPRQQYLLIWRISTWRKIMNVTQTERVIATTAQCINLRHAERALAVIKQDIVFIHTDVVMLIKGNTI